jgi:YVTN family beta-propeller protein
MNRKMKRPSRRLIAALSIAALPVLVSSAQAQNQLVNGKKITLPPVGTITRTLPGAVSSYGIVPNIGSHAANLVASPDGKYAVATDLGFREYLSSIDTSNGMLVSQLSYGPPYSSGTFGLFFGLVFSPIANPDGSWTLYAAQGNNNTIAVLHLNPANGALTQVMSGALPLTIHSAGSVDFPAGLAISADGKYLYVANHQAEASNVAGSMSSFYVSTDGKFAYGAQIGRYNFTGVSSAVTLPAAIGGGTASNFPYAIAVKGNTVYVAGSTDGHVYAIDVTSAATPALIKEIATGSHPLGLLVSGSTLYVSNAHSDSISVVNTTTNTITNTIDLRPEGAKSLVGVTPNQMAISPDGTTLYAALSDMQAVALINTATNAIKGEIPVGWYPTAVVPTSDGKRILVANARGTQTRYPNPGQKVDTGAPALPPIGPGQYDESQYTLNQIEANVETIQEPNPIQLMKYTLMVLSNNQITPSTDSAAINPLYAISKANNDITHVFYIIRENRTYDQELGDVAQGNGDPSLVLFGSAVTPNIHRLAQQFVLLDNFYDIGDASMEGWDWSTTALSNEHIARNQPYNYSGRGSNYDSEGYVNGYSVGGFPAGAQGYYVYDANGLATTPYFAAGRTSGGVALPAIPDAGGHPNGRIPDTILRAGGTVRDYGALLTNGYPDYPAFQPGGHYDASMGPYNPASPGASGYTDVDFSGFDTNFAESPAAALYGLSAAQLKVLSPHVAYGNYGSQDRFTEWNREFQAMVANDPANTDPTKNDLPTIPNFELVRFGRDHTGGVNAGHASAKAEVADNDYACGKLVEAIRNSKIWAHSAIFILEDDAQNGPDHVDSHRSVGYVISPYIKANSVSHKFYNTTAFLRNIELLLNAEPLTQYDAIASPLDAWDLTGPNNNPDLTAILPAQNIVTEVLTPGSYETARQNREFKRLMALASKMDLVHADAADPALLNEMIWKSVKGMDSRMPAPKHSGPIDVLIARKSIKASKAGKKAARVVRDSDD